MSQPQFDPEEVARFENATWSRCAETYAEGFGALVAEAIGPLLDEVKVREGDRVLDVGTGTGLVAAAAVERGAEVVGIDFSEAMVAEARRLHRDIQFKQASADSLPSADGSFDAVVGNFVLHHTGQPNEVLGEAFRVLREGGRVGFTVWGDPMKLEAFGLFFSVVEELAGTVEFPHGPLFGVSDFDGFHGMLQEAGFRDSSVSELPIQWRTDSLDSYLAGFCDWADLDKLPRPSRDRIEATVRERAEAYRSGDSFVMPNPAILMSGVK